MSRNFTLAAVAVAVFIGGAIGFFMSTGTVAETIYAGSLRGVNACVASVSTQSTTVEQARSICAAKHATNLTRIVPVQGQGALHNTERAGIQFEGQLTNTHASYLITYVKMELALFDDEGEKTTFTASENLWAPPFDDVEFRPHFSTIVPENALGLEWCEHDVPEVDLRSCKTWDIELVAGVPT